MDNTDFRKSDEIKVAYLCNGKRSCSGKPGCSYSDNELGAMCRHTTDKLYSLTGKDFENNRESFVEAYPGSNAYMEVEE